MKVNARSVTPCAATDQTSRGRSRFSRKKAHAAAGDGDEQSGKKKDEVSVRKT
jgi:hypothetical protein